MLHGCKTGDAKITRGYRLPAAHVIHTVGPVWQGGDRDEPELLASCYRRSIALCHKQSLASVAFPAISTGIYRFPADRAARIAVGTTLEAIQPETSLQHIVFCCFSEESARLHDQAFSELTANRIH
jgi:O-acetyl-ADP-ribose deacetylase